MWATGRGFIDHGFAELTLFFVRFGLTAKPINLFDKQEHGERHDQKIDQLIHEIPERDRVMENDKLDAGEINMTRENPDDRIDHIIDQGINHGRKRRANHYSDREVERTTLDREFFKFFPHIILL